MIKIKRAYEDVHPEDGIRILVDRLWPRGVRKEDLAAEDWIKELAPSDELRCWFNHQPEKWQEFLSRYFSELDKKQGYWEPILKRAEHDCITLLYAARDREHNNAEALRHYLNSRRANEREPQGN